MVSDVNFPTTHRKGWNQNLIECESDVFAVILGALSDQHKIHYGQAETVIELVSNLFVGHDLIERHYQVALHKQESATYSMFGRMADHLNHFRNTFNRLASSGETRSESHEIVKVLEGLDTKNGGPEHVQSTRNFLFRKRVAPCSSLDRENTNAKQTQN